MKTKSKSSVLMIILLMGMFVPLVFSTAISSASGIETATDPYQRLIVYSETTTGEPLIGNISLNGWEGKAAVSETTVSPYEGTNAINITMVDDVWNWWGVGLELSVNENLIDFAGGYISFMINTSYTGNLSAGFQSPGQDVVIVLTPGMYGYNNDSQWHRVFLPIDTLLAANPNADLTQVFNAFMITSSGDAQWESIFIDDIYWQAYPPRTIIYSETTTGEALQGNVSLNGWEGKAAVTETAISPYEGTNAINITMVDDAWNWWGVGLELSLLENMADFAGGYLSFMINTTYSGNLSVGFQSPGQDVVIVLSPGMYGYNNDSQWHRVFLPIETLLAANPNADLTQIFNAFMITSSGDAQWESIFIDDIYWQVFPPRTIVYSETTIGDELEGTVGLNGWEGKAAVSETTVSPFEGTSAINITMVDDVWNWWGVGLELSVLENMADYAGGYLSFMINTTYSGNLSVGFQSPGQDVVVLLAPGLYGFNNDSLWHRVIIPMDDLLAANPNGDLTHVFNAFMITSSGDAQWESIFIDDIYWQRIAPQKIVYSETRDGDDLLGTVNLNGWEGKAAVSETTVSPYEGTSAINITMVDDVWNWWGVGLELSVLENMVDYAGGYLSFMINTSYSGNLSVGFQSPGQDVVVILAPGLYGFNNDSQWHRIVLPIDDLLAANPNGDLAHVFNAFMITSSGDAQWESIFIDDIYWLAAAGEAKQWIPEVENVNLELDDETGDIVLSYDFLDLNGDDDMSVIQWYRNDTEMVEFANELTIPAENLSLWDIWMANVTPYDGIDYGETVTSNAIFIIPERTLDPNYLVIYSEFHPGVELDTGLEWTDWDGTASLEFVLDDTAPDGLEVGKIVKTEDDTWWGVSIHTLPQDSGDLSEYATGTLNFMMKTTYAYEIRVGVNNYSPSQDYDAWVTLSDAYGFANDGSWHQVSVPVADIIAANPDVNLESLDNVFAILFGENGVENDVPIYFDNVYYEMGTTPLVSDANIFFDPVNGGIKLEYDFSDPQGDTDQSTIRWYKNGELMGEYNDSTTVPDAALFRDDVWYAIVTPFDGTNYGAPVQTNNATVPSTYPVAGGDDTGGDDTSISIPGYPVFALLGVTALSLVFFMYKKRKN